MSIDVREALSPEVFDLLQESVMLRGIDGRVLYWNRASERLYGWSAERALGRDANELLDTQHDAGVAALEATLAIEPHWHGRLRRRTAGGAPLTVDVRWLLRRDVAGRPAAILETGRDVSVRGRSTLTSDDCERRYLTLFDSPAAAFLELDFAGVGGVVSELRRSGVTDLDAHLRAHPDIVRQMIRAARVVEVNDQALERFGPGRREDLLGPVDRYWPAAATPVFGESVVAAVTGQPNFVREVRLRTLHGVEFDAELAVHFDADSTHSGLVTIAVVDVTERNRARTAFEHAQFMYRNLFHGMAVPFLRMDSTHLTRMFAQLHADGVTDIAEYMAVHPEFVSAALEASIVVEANAPAVKLYGAPDADALKGPLSRLLRPTDELRAFRNSLIAGYNGAPGYQAETKVRRLDGREIDILLFVIATPEMRERGIVLAGNIDIAEQVAARAALQRMQTDLAHAARVSMLGELTASIAHEVNQPLTAITTNAEAGLRWLGRAQPDVDETRTLMSRVVADARRAADIIQRVRGMATRHGAENAALALNGIIDDATRFLDHEMQAHAVTLVLELSSDAPRIHGDRIQLQQVFVNLAVNAIQAMCGAACDRRVLRIATRAVDPGHVRVDVRDSGPGIAQDSLPRLFERFYSTKRDGMGMGLAICQSIVEAHGGHISATNAPGGGALFSVVLPVSGA